MSSPTVFWSSITTKKNKLYKNTDETEGQEHHNNFRNLILMRRLMRRRAVVVGVAPARILRRRVAVHCMAHPRPSERAVVENSWRRRRPAEVCARRGASMPARRILCRGRLIARRRRRQDLLGERASERTPGSFDRLGRIPGSVVHQRLPETTAELDCPVAYTEPPRRNLRVTVALRTSRQFRVCRSEFILRTDSRQIRQTAPAVGAAGWSGRPHESHDF